MKNEVPVKLDKVTITLIKRVRGVPVEKIVVHPDGTETVEKLK